MFKLSFKKNIFCFIFVLLSGESSLVFASVASEVNKANDLYKQEKFNDSLDLYQRALDRNDQSSVIKYDLGTAYYKKGNYPKAIEYLKQAAQDKNIKIKPKAEYNLGNVFYKAGIQKENSNIDQAIKSLQESLGHYAESIAQDPKDQDALDNQGFVKQEIERLKKKKQEQQQQQQNQKKPNKNQQEQNKKDQQKQQNQQSQQNQQNQQNQQTQQNQQDQKDQQNQQNQNNQQAKASSEANKKEDQEKQTSMSQKEIDRKQAEDLLEDYKDNEEPKKLLNYMPKKIDDRPVLKDW